MKNQRISCVVAVLCIAPVAGSAGAGPAVDTAVATVSAEDSDRGTRLQGRVFLGRRNGVVGASIVALPADDAGRIYITSSNLRGEFRLESLPDAEYELTVSRDGLVPVRKAGVTLRHPFRAVVEIPMQPAAVGGTRPTSADASEVHRSLDAARFDVEGRARDEDGQPLSDVVVRLVSADASADPRMLRSGLGGRFALAGLAAGHWEIEVRGVGYLPVRATIGVIRDATLHVTLVRQPADYRPTPLELMPPEVPLPPA